MTLSEDWDAEHFFVDYHGGRNDSDGEAIRVLYDDQERVTEIIATSFGGSIGGYDFPNFFTKECQ